MDKKKILQLLGLAMRARKVVLGEEFVLKELSKNNDSILFLASDSGDNIKKKVEERASYYDFTCIDFFTTDELSSAIGKQNRKTILVLDKGFNRKFREYLDS